MVLKGTEESNKFLNLTAMKFRKYKQKLGVILF